MSVNLPPINSRLRDDSMKPKKPKLIGPLPPIETRKQDVSSMWRKIENKIHPVILPKLIAAEKNSEAALEDYITDTGRITQTSADFVKKFDFFAEFLAGNDIDARKFSEYLKFQNFCKIHGDSERKQRLFYSLKARKSIIQRQIQVVDEELISLDDASRVFNQIASDNSENIQDLFNQLVEKYSKLSYELVSIKAKEEFWKTKLKLQKAVADRGIDDDQVNIMKQELNIEYLLSISLDKHISELVTLNFDILSSDPMAPEVMTEPPKQEEDPRPQSKQYMEALNQLIHLKPKPKKRAK
ncbi:unnamed protein product [Bursaphelenchus xylophilus]|uniref:(pine wood nematode) hypothetical protein n=1 Tax=Bursaphelenchus xylophilus TaxID=6326 RepID=A0A1I7S3R5_BURXY|nr:unnamed protein product [Bursaphelenchus xylophilus]CAG9116482.1 unnamed protein product [Bursaphelenchus xylophilus]